MPTLNELIDEVKANLQGYALRQDRITYVANPSGLTTTSTEIIVGSQNNLAKPCGIINLNAVKSSKSQCSKIPTNPRKVLQIRRFPCSSGVGK